MLTIVLVGNSCTRRLNGNPAYIYSPRGYFGGAPT